MLFHFFFLFILNQHNPDVISNQIRAKRKEKKIKCFKLQKVNTLEVPTFPFLNTVGCVTDVFWPRTRLTPLRPSPLRWLRQDFLLRRSRFCKSPFFFDKTEASHSHKMHKKTRQIQRHNRYCTNWNSTAHRTISRVTCRTVYCKTHNTNTPMNTRTNVTIVCIFFRLHQYLFL